MYKISLLFESNIAGVYTKEEEIATDEEWKRKKVLRMLERWFNNFSFQYDLMEDEINDDEFDGQLYLFHIERRIKKLNKEDGGNRKFTFTVEKLD